MKANELRIGNLVFSNGSVVEVEGVDNFSGITTTANFEGSCNGEIAPILLTEDWLITLGFKETEQVNGEYGNGLAYQIQSWGRIGLKNGILQSDEYYF